MQLPAISDQLAGLFYSTQSSDTVHVVGVQPNGAAHVAGLNIGDRVLSVDGLSVAGTPYNCIKETIQQASTTLKLIVMRRECDNLPMVRNFCWLTERKASYGPLRAHIIVLKRTGEYILL